MTCLTRRRGDRGDRNSKFFSFSALSAPPREFHRTSLLPFRHDHQFTIFDFDILKFIHGCLRACIVVDVSGEVLFANFFHVHLRHPFSSYHKRLRRNPKNSISKNQFESSSAIEVSPPENGQTQLVHWHTHLPV